MDPSERESEMVIKSTPTNALWWSHFVYFVGFAKQSRLLHCYHSLLCALCVDWNSFLECQEHYHQISFIVTDISILNALSSASSHVRIHSVQMQPNFSKKNICIQIYQMETRKYSHSWIAFIRKTGPFSKESGLYGQVTRTHYWKSIIIVICNETLKRAHESHNRLQTLFSRFIHSSSERTSHTAYITENHAMFFVFGSFACEIFHLSISIRCFCTSHYLVGHKCSTENSCNRQTTQQWRRSILPKEKEWLSEIERERKMVWIVMHNFTHSLHFTIIVRSRPVYSLAFVYRRGGEE